MAFERLKAAVWKANQDIVRSGLVQLTWGNASGVDRAAGVMAIKPSGVDYDQLRAEDIVVLELESGCVVEGTLRPSTDAPTHRYLYLSFPEIGAVVHTHSRYAVAWAQARRPIPCLGTTHADHFYGEIPVTRPLRPEEVVEAYEHQTGVVIAECFRERQLDPLEVPGVLVAGHGPFAWGETPEKAAENALVLELVAEMAFYTYQINPEAPALEQYVLEKHFRRKHGSQAYYGQR
jgi:L-ribulose-5-phosphate 4-epimerase